MCAVVVSETSPLEFCSRRKNPVVRFYFYEALFHCTTNSGHFFTQSFNYDMTTKFVETTMASLQKAALLFYIWPYPSPRSCLAHPTANTSPRNPAAAAGNSVHTRQSPAKKVITAILPVILHYGVSNPSSSTPVSVPRPDDSSRPALVTAVCSDLGVPDLSSRLFSQIPKFLQEEALGGFLSVTDRVFDKRRRSRISVLCWLNRVCNSNMCLAILIPRQCCCCHFAFTLCRRIIKLCL